MNTDHLGFKLLSGTLKKKRKHSEQLNKFLAGFFDADGCVTVFVDERYNSIVLAANIVQSESNDRSYRMIKALQDYYDIGTLSYRTYESEQHSDAITWSFNTKDTIKLFNLIGKHLFIKHYHFKNCIGLYNHWKTKKPDAQFIQEIREESRELSSIYHRNVKHISPAYLSGLIAGDGWVEVAIAKRKVNKDNTISFRNQLSIEIKLNIKDAEVLEKIQQDYGGNLYYRTHDNCFRWRLNLGKNNTKAKLIVSKLLSYMCLEKKYDLLEQINLFYKQLAQTK